MDTKTRQAMIQRQREYVASTEGQCPHLIQCAVTPEQVDSAIVLLRSGIGHDAFLGAAMLSGPCRNHDEENN